MYGHASNPMACTYDETISVALAGTTFECLPIDLFDDIIVTELGLMGQLALGQTSKAMHKYLIGDEAHPRRAFIPRQWKRKRPRFSCRLGGDDADNNRALREFQRVLLEACHRIMEESKGSFRYAGRNYLRLRRGWVDPVGLPNQRDRSSFFGPSYKGGRSINNHRMSVQFYYDKHMMSASFEIHVTATWRCVGEYYLGILHAMGPWYFSRPIEVNNLNALFSIIRRQPDVVHALASAARIITDSSHVLHYIEATLATKTAYHSVQASLENISRLLKRELCHFPVPMIDNHGVVTDALTTLQTNLKTLLDLRTEFRQVSTTPHSQMPSISESFYTREELTHYARPSKRRRIDCD